MKKDLLDLKNPTVNQLDYMKDLYPKETLINYMVNKWEGKFNTQMSDKDWSKWHRELKYLKLDSMSVLNEMSDWCNI